MNNSNSNTAINNYNANNYNVYNCPYRLPCGYCTKLYRDCPKTPTYVTYNQTTGIKGEAWNLDTWTPNCNNLTHKEE